MKHCPSQAVTPWLAQGACTANVLKAQVQKRQSLLGNGGHDEVRMMDWMMLQERGLHRFDPDSRDFGTFNALFEAPAEAYVHALPIVSMSPTTARLWSDRRCAPQRWAISRDVRKRGRSPTKLLSSPMTYSCACGGVSPLYR